MENKKFVAIHTKEELTVQEVEEIKKNLCKLSDFNFVFVDARINLG